MATQTQKNYVIGWSDDVIVPIILINVNGEWLPPNNLPTGIRNNNYLRKRLSQICFGFVFIGFSLLFSPSRVRAMQSSEAAVSQAILEKPTREHQLRNQGSTDEVRMECLLKRKNPCVIGCPKGIDWSMQEVMDENYPYYRSHPDIEAEVIERGMIPYDPNILGPEKLWAWNYNLAHRLKMSTYRLRSLVYYRENTVLPYLAYLKTEPNSTMGGDIKESMDNAISVAMKSVAEHILLDL